MTKDEIAVTPQDELKYHTWTWWPEDTLDALDLLLVYLGVNDSLRRPPVTSPVNHRKPQERQIPMRRAMGQKAWQSALKLLNPCRRRPVPQHGQYWCLHPVTNYRDRLATAGIDIDTVQICDRRKFAFAWQQLTEGFRPMYAQAKQLKLLETDQPPKIVPLVKSFIMKPRRDPALVLKEHAEKLRAKNWDLNDKAERGLDLDPVNTLGEALTKRKL